MNKEQLIRELKYTKEKHKNDKLFTFDTDISVMCNDVLDVLSRCVEIPDNATNGDVLKALFPNERIGHCEDCTDLGDIATFDDEWWNSPYK